MMSESPIEPLVDATKKASIHFARAGFEVVRGIGALMSGVVNVVRDDESEAEPPPAEHIPVE